ncbi:MAG: H-type lectin domain-containing protein [Candidatus Nitrotoga sp.]|nr:H-type lectin domain-containing protein [Candidatus Nitrotoga sp.]
MSDKKDKPNSIQKDKARKSRTRSDKKDKLLHSATPDSFVTSDATVNSKRDAILTPGPVVLTPMFFATGPVADKWYLSGWLGIGTTTPNAPLEIMPTVNGLSTGLQFDGQHIPGLTAGGVINSCDANGHVRPLTLQKNGGNVGIGTYLPNARLTIQTPEPYGGNTLRIESKNEPQMYYLNLNTVVTNSVVRWVFDQTNAGTNFPSVLAFDRGNVGIGTAEPTHPLHLKTNWGFLALDSNTAGQDSGIRLMEGGAVKWHFFNSAKDTKLYLARDGLSASLTIDQNGSVGIGTSSPIGALHIKGNGGVLAIEGTDHGYIQFFPQTTSVRRGWIGSGLSVGDHSFTISSDSERMHITGGEYLYLLNKSGVIVSKAWGGNGNLTVEGNIAVVGGTFQLNGGAVFNKFQSGTTFLGSNGVQSGSISRSISFPEPFSSVPRVIVTARDLDGHPDMFAVSTKQINENEFSVNVRRLDSWPSNTWGLDLYLDWLAWT